MRAPIPHPSATRSLPKREYPDLGVQPRPTKEEFERKNREATIERYQLMRDEIDSAINQLKGVPKKEEPVLVPVKIEKVEAKPFVAPVSKPVTKSTLLNKQPSNISNISKKTSSKK